MAWMFDRDSDGRWMIYDDARADDHVLCSGIQTADEARMLVAALNQLPRPQPPQVKPLMGRRRST